MESFTLYYKVEGLPLQYLNQKNHALECLTISQVALEGGVAYLEYILTCLHFLHIMTGEVPLSMQWYDLRFLQGNPSHGNGAGNASEPG